MRSASCRGVMLGERSHVTYFHRLKLPTDPLLAPNRYEHLHMTFNRPLNGAVALQCLPIFHHLGDVTATVCAPFTLCHGRWLPDLSGST